MWLNPKQNVALLCVSTNDQMINSNVVPPISALSYEFFGKKKSEAGATVNFIIGKIKIIFCYLEVTKYLVILNHSFLFCRTA